MPRLVFAPAVLVLLFLIGGAGSAAAQDLPVPHVTVSGEASRAVEPSLAEARAGVITQGKSAREASEANARTMTAVLASLKEAGVEPKDIQTSRFAVQPLFTRQQQEGRSDSSRITGYQVSNNVTVKIRDVGQLGEIFDRLLAAGANTIYGVEFQVPENPKLLDTVRAAAVADAKRKAELYAQAAGVQLGRVFAITENSVSVPRPIMRAAAAPQAATPISPGEEVLRVSVTVTFELSR